MKTRIQITKLEALHLLTALNIASETTQEASYQIANLNLRKKILKAIDRTHFDIDNNATEIGAHPWK